MECLTITTQRGGALDLEVFPIDWKTPAAPTEASDEDSKQMRGKSLE